MGGQRALATVGVISSVALLSCALLYYTQHQQQQQQRRRRRRRRGMTLQGKKPQERFRCVLADNSLTPFVHLRTEENGSGFSHPYYERLRALLEHLPLSFLFMQPGYKEPPGMKGTFEWIETGDELQALAQVLSEETEFAVDTEQHSSHSFHGFTALVQISTQKTDYVVDSIALHDSMSVLGAVFANPAICKVFHGADSDILWLQRDFHIYVVNMFDTAKACLILGKPQRSLASLLQIYCDVVTNKAFQRADWRLRPLPADMLEYARTDAHYLLYIAHRLCMELVQNSSDERKQEVGMDMGGIYFGRLLEQAVYRSNLSCLQLYEKEGPSASRSSTSATLLSRLYNSHGFPPPAQMDDKFLNLVTSLCEWRDNLARIEDESLRSVLSDTALMALATSAPSTPEAICATISAADASPQAPDAATSAIIPSFTSPSPTVEKYIDDLHSVIQRSGAGQSELSRTFFNGLVENVFSLFKLSSDVEKDHGYQCKDVSSAGTPEHKLSRRWRLGTADKARMQFVKKFSCKAPVYHNCRIYADDGRLLCFCDRKKLEWYVSRELAEFVQEDPPAVRLLFAPKGRPEDEGNDFYIQSKSNQCVGCGESSHYLRYRIIPSCYRQFFPEHLKSHRSHDIVLLCVDCHEVAHKAAEKHKRQIAAEYGVPLFAKVMDTDGLAGGQHKAVSSDEGAGGVSPLLLKNSAMALLRHGPTIPTERRRELEKVVQTYYGRENISQEDLHAVLLLSMGPQERRRLMKKGLYKEKSSTATAAEGLGPSAVHYESPRNQADIPAPLQVEENIIARSEQAIPTTDVVDLKQPANTAVQCGASSQNAKDKEVSAWSNWEGKDNDRLLLENLSLKRGSGRYKGRKNESLLGHGIHGRRVVEIVMKQDGDEGIRTFSQRWRKVFVDSLHPAFLPLGWEISHSGRREFGDFSVYKPLEEGQ